MTRNDFLRNLEQLLGVPAGSLKGPEVVDGLDAWDSLGIVSFLAFLDKAFNVSASSAELGNCDTVNDLIRLAGPGIHG